MNTYDQVAYPSYPLPQTHPRHLETIATLLGLEPPSSNACRVLELGCGNGGNLIPMGCSSSNCRFIGIDSSAKQIEIGKRQIELLELTNVELIHRSIEEIDPTFGQFDYILCHGVFSWVSPSVQSDILRLVRDRLVKNGIGFISFNTYPGWHQRGVIRNMMRYHVGRFPDEEPSQRIGRARGLLEFLTRATPAQQTSYGMLLRENLEQLSRLPDAYLFHEHLEEFNEPIWFLDFCEMLAPVGLRYLADADFSTMMANFGFNTEARQELDTIAPNLLEKEQYLDFLRNRLFRQTLVCHDSQRPNYSVRAKQVFKMHIGSRLKPTSATVDFSNQSPQEFTTGSGMSVETIQPIFKAALVVLQNVWPCTILFDDLLYQATELLQSTDYSQDLSQ
ncbi:MAG TPA: class I SAM-dependent methyltransferase, partial [Pirellula sp.]|nr:class I SAM-dependent methyltransferase [Pirellula sp.]